MMVPAIAFWHHATTLMMHGKLTRWRGIRIGIAYLLALMCVGVQVRTPVLIRLEEQSPLYLNTLHANIWYMVIGSVFVILICLSVINLISAARAASPGTRLLRQGRVFGDDQGPDQGRRRCRLPRALRRRPDRAG